MANISVVVQDANNVQLNLTPAPATTLIAEGGNNVTLELTPTPTQVITLDRGVAGVGIESVSVIDVGGSQYLHIVFTNGSTSDVGPIATSTYFGVSPVVVTGDQISLSTVPLTLGGTGATTAAGARTNLGLGTMSTQNANSVAVTGGLISNTTLSGATVDNAAPYLNFANGSGTTLVPGRMWYDGATGSWNLGMGNGNITQQVGEEFFVYGKASSAVADSPLQIIYQTGTVGSSGVITFAPTIAGITNGDKIIGVATESLALNATGRITSSGVVRGITTNGTAFGETWADGDVIWYNPTTGNPTNVKPSAPNIKVSIGTIINAGNGGSGSIQVEINHGSVLGGTDSNVQLTSVANGDILTYDGASSFWKNTSLTAGNGVNVSKSSNGVLTVSNTGVTSVTGTAPVVSSGGATPAISMAAASSTVNGYLTSADWNTFNNKQPAGAVTSVSGTTGRITSTGGTAPVIDLASGIATAGTTGSSTLIPVVTVDTYGRVTSLTTAANPQGTVTSVGGTGTVNGLTLTGTVTSTGNLTLGGTLSGVANSALTNSAITFGATSQALGSTVSALNAVSVGATTPSTGSFTSLTNSGNLTFTGTGNRITGDFSNATLANRVMFQTSTINGNTRLGLLPNGTATTTSQSFFNSTDPANSGFLALSFSSTDAQINSGISGTGTYLPISFLTGGSEAVRIGATSGVDKGTVGIGYTSLSGVGVNGLAVAGNVGIGTSSPAYKLSVQTAVGGGFNMSNGVDATLRVLLPTTGITYDNVNFGYHAWLVGGSEKMRIDSSGNVLVTSPSGLGYGTGSGGTVTQATSKSTAVTLNKTTGQITMNNAALAANTTVGFILNNSLLGPADSMTVAVAFGAADYSTYQCWVANIGGGGVRIFVRNISGGSLSETLVLNFAVIKGATA